MSTTTDNQVENGAENKTENGNATGLNIKLQDIVSLYTSAQIHFRLFPDLTDEQCRTYIAIGCPFRFSHIQLYQTLTSRATEQAQFVDILSKFQEAAEQMLRES
jgi:hypothetical protein